MIILRNLMMPYSVRCFVMSSQEGIYKPISDRIVFIVQLIIFFSLFGNLEIGAVTRCVKIDSIYSIVEEMPQFKSGFHEGGKYVARNLRYPNDALKNRKHGVVIISFVVEKDGVITDAKVVKKLYPSLDAEAIRVINSMPRWIPGRIRGKVIRCKYTMPVYFNLP